MENKAEILIVEDSLTQALQLQHLLQKNGYVVRVANNGAEGLASVQADKPAIIITDIMMPEMDGYELCARIKQDETLKDIPVVLLTSRSDPRNVIKGLQCGADSFLTKPYVDEQLLRRLHHILANLELRKAGSAQLAVEVFFMGARHTLTADRIQIIDLLLSSFEATILENSHLEKVIADYQAALEEIKILQQNYRELLETRPDAIVVVDAAGEVRYANPAAETLFEQPVTAWIGQPCGLPFEQGNQKQVGLRTVSGKQIVADLQVFDSYWEDEAVRLLTVVDVTETAALRKAQGKDQPQRERSVPDEQN